ncbi:glycosyltransferase, partial [bacterium]|nr:glycosyltransferase [bacterium]
NIAWIANTINGEKFRHEYDYFYIFYNGFLLSIGTPHVRYIPGPPLLPQLEVISPGVRGLPFKFFRWLYQHFLRKLQPAYELHEDGNYVTISQFTASLFQQAHGVELPVIYPPIDLAGRNFHLDDLNCRDTLTFFSRIVDYKRPEMVLDLANKYRHIRCVIMGAVSQHRRPFYEKLQRLAKEMGMTEIIFLENPSNQRVKEELSRTRFYIFPTINEHFGITTVEAIASGAIPYVHDSGGQKEIVIDPRLRFLDSEFIKKFDVLTKLSSEELNGIRRSLLAHIQQYSETVYNAKMLSFIGL